MNPDSVKMRLTKEVQLDQTIKIRLIAPEIRFLNFSVRISW
jgi:hypothetical protein